LTLSSGAGGPPCTAGIVADDNDVITFNVDNSVGIEEQTTKKELLRTTDLLGRETTDNKDEVLFYIYNDGTVEKRIVIE